MRIQGEVKLQSLFHSLKHVLKNTHSSGFQISVASGIITVTGLIFALKDGRGKRGFNHLFSFLWSSTPESDSSPDELWVVPGLQNLGNNCFLNVVLQVLQSLAYLSFDGL